MKTTIILLGAILAAWNVKAQQSFRIVPESSKMTIEGTSTVQSKSIVNGYSLMNDKTYDALKADRYPEIRFKLESTRNVAVANGAFSGNATGTYSSETEFRFSQIGTEALYRFGRDEQFFGGVLYNLVNGDTDLSTSGDRSVSRFQAGAGWFILKSTVLKLEYVNQDYTDSIADYGYDAGFNGLMVEAAISF